MTSGTAWAQDYYAAPDGTGATCSPADPCTAETALETAADGEDVHFLVSNVGGRNIYPGDDDDPIEIDSSPILHVYTYDGTDATEPDEGGVVILQADVDFVAGAATVEIPDEDVALLFGGNREVRLVDVSVEFFGPGPVGFTTRTGQHEVVFADEADDDGDITLAFENFFVNKAGGSVEFRAGENFGDEEEGWVLINNRLDVQAGSVNFSEDAAVRAQPDAYESGEFETGVFIASGASINIEQSESFFISPDPTTDFNDDPANDADPDFSGGDAFMISGGGALNARFIKDTEATVVTDLDALGIGGTSEIISGRFYATDATTFNGDLLVEGGEAFFYMLSAFNGLLNVVDNDGDNFSDTYATFFSAVEFTSGIDLIGTDDGTGGGDSGYDGDLVFDGTTTDNDEGGPVVTFSGALVPDGTMAASVLLRDSQVNNISLNADGNTTINLGARSGDGAYHNLALEGDLSAGVAPNFNLAAPADAFVDSDPVLCGDYDIEAVGNKVIFQGDADQELLYSTELEIASVKIDKDATSDIVELDEDNATTFIIWETLEVMNGRFITNGLLDAGMGGEEATVVINWSQDGLGILDAGDSARAYVSDDDGDTPNKVKYTGNIGIFTADEIPGPRAGSEAGTEIELDEVEIAMENDQAVITFGKSFTIDEEFRLTRGNADVGSANIKLENGVLIAIGDGEIRRTGTPPFFGALVFPTNPDYEFDFGDGSFDVSEDGIDLLYFGTTNRTVSLEWPSDATGFVTDPLNVIRDVAVAAECDDDLVIALREDEVFQVNQDLFAGFDPYENFFPNFGAPPDADNDAYGTLDIDGNTLQVNAVNGFDTWVYASTNGDVYDSAFYATDDDEAGKVDIAEWGMLTSSLKGVRAAEEGNAKYQEAASALEALASANTLADKSQQDTLDIGLVLFIGTQETRVIHETERGELLSRIFPATEVNRVPADDDDEARVLFSSDANVLLAGETVTPLDQLHLPYLTVTAAHDGSSTGTNDAGAGVAICKGWDVFEISGNYTQFSGETGLAIPCFFGEDARLEKADGNGFSSPSANGATDFTPDGFYWFQQFMVGTGSFENPQAGNHVQEDGEFYGNGGDETVYGDFQLGLTDAGSTALWNGAPGPGGSPFVTKQDGEQEEFASHHIQMGNWYVGADEEDTPGLYLGSPCVTPSDDACGHETADNDVVNRNQYAQGGFEHGATLWMYGPDWQMWGTFDNFADAFNPGIQQGADGLIIYGGDLLQTVTQRQDEDAFVHKVLLAADPGIEIQTSLWGNFFSTFWLELGDINSPESNVPGGDPENEVIVLNPIPEGADAVSYGPQQITFSGPGLANRNNSLQQWVSGFAEGARDSYVAFNTPIRRNVTEGQATGGEVTGFAYVYPHGFFIEGNESLPQGREFSTPLMLQFANDQGEGLYGKSTILPPMETAPELEFEPIRVDAAGPGETVISDGLLINAVADIFYRVEFFNDVLADQSAGGGPNADIPGEDPNIRIVADGLPGTGRLGIDRVRILHWDCEGNFLGLAGVYDLFGDDIDDSSRRNNDFINGIPNLIQEGVNVRSCNIFGLGANAFENPIDGPWGGSGFNEGVAGVQFIHDAPGTPAVDVYVDGDYAATLEFEANDGDETPKATAFGSVAEGSQEVALVEAGGDLGDALLTQTISFVQNENYVVFLSGADDVQLDVIADASTEASNQETISAMFQHNAPDAPEEVDIRGLNPFDNNDANRIFANNLSFLDNTGYISLDPQTYSIELASGDLAEVAGVYFFELDGFAGQALSCFASNTDLDGSGVAILCATASGQIIVPDVVTDTEGTEELPTEFALDGNYPNPFNPSTTIQFDLPETAEVSLEIVDMLGRQVMTLPAQTMQAGADRQIQVNASSLASGVYVYRLVVKTADSKPEFKTGRMTLIK